MSAPLAGRDAAQYTSFAAVITTDLTAFCPFLPVMNVCRSYRPAAGCWTRVSVPSLMAVIRLVPRSATTSARIRRRTSALTL